MLHTPNRTSHINAISTELLKLGQKDLRIGQVFEILRARIGTTNGGLFNIENKQLLKLLKELNSEEFQNKCIKYHTGSDDFRKGWQ